MTNVILGYGAILVVLGVGGYLGSGRASATALIPAIIGALALVCGVLARKETMRKHAIHAALVIALLALLGTVGGVIAVAKWAAGTAPANPMAAVAKTVTALLSAGVIFLGVRSFRAARLAREAAGSPPS